MQDLPYLVTHRLSPILLAMSIFGSDLLDQRFQRGPAPQRLEPTVAIFHPNFEFFAFPQVALFEYCLRDADRLTVAPLHELCPGARHNLTPRFQVYTLVYPCQGSPWLLRLAGRRIQRCCSPLVWGRAPSPVQAERSSAAACGHSDSGFAIVHARRAVP